MNAVDRFRSALLACGVLTTDAQRCAEGYEVALRTDATGDWVAFYRCVYDSMSALRYRIHALGVFAKIEIGDVLLLLQDDLGAQLFEPRDIAALARDLLEPGERELTA